MRTLEELNLVDDFLVNSLTSHKVYGEQSARYILECILHRPIGKLTVVPQRFFGGENTEAHGIRLDVYLDEENGEIFDIEPDQNDGKGDLAALPRRARFYHAKIDAGNLPAGNCTSTPTKTTGNCLFWRQFHRHRTSADAITFAGGLLFCKRRFL